MSLLKMKDVSKMDKKTRENKLNELKMEFIRSNVSANKRGSKTKEIKKAIARIITFNKMELKKSKELKQK